MATDPRHTNHPQSTSCVNGMQRGLDMFTTLGKHFAEARVLEVMDVARRLDAYCDACQDVRSCRLQEDDPGSCACVVCGHVILLMKPLA